MEVKQGQLRQKLLVRYIFWERSIKKLDVQELSLLQPTIIPQQPNDIEKAKAQSVILTLLPTISFCFSQDSSDT